MPIKPFGCERELRGLRAPATSPTTGASLVQEARRRLATSLSQNRAFGNDARITQAQAQANALGYVAQHFQEIDTAKSGKVSLKQVQEYLQQQQ